METIKKLGLAALILVSSLYSCEKSDLRPDTQQLKTEKVVETPLWMVSSFQWRNGERNDQFSGYLFQFDPNGLITVINQGEREYGKWTRTNDILKIEFQTRPLTLLNNKWTVLEETRMKMKLGGLSPYDNMAEIIQFENMNFAASN